VPASYGRADNVIQGTKDGEAQHRDGWGAGLLTTAATIRQIARTLPLIADRAFLINYASWLESEAVSIDGGGEGQSTGSADVGRAGRSPFRSYPSLTELVSQVVGAEEDLRVR